MMVSSFPLMGNGHVSASEAAEAGRLMPLQTMDASCDASVAKYSFLSSTRRERPAWIKDLAAM